MTGYAWDCVTWLLAGYYLATCVKCVAGWIASGRKSSILSAVLGLVLFLAALLDRSPATVLICFAAGISIMLYGLRKSGLYRDGA